MRSAAGGGGTAIAVLGAVRSPNVPQCTFRTSAAIAVAVLTLTALGLVGVTRGLIIADSGWHLTQSVPLTPELREIWSAVRERTPKDALVFTDQVDKTENILGGWNTYAYTGQRQIYLSSYFTNFELRHDRQKLAEVLAIN